MLRAREEAEDELTDLRLQMRAQAEEETRVALDRQLIELAGSREEQQQVKAQKEKEQRIDDLRKRVGRRMMNAGLASGWAAWHELWAAKTYALDRLRRTGKRLRGGIIVSSFDDWAASAREARKAAAHAADLATREQELTAETAALEAELAAMREHCRLQLVAAAEERRVALERQKVELLGSAAEQAELREEKAKEERIELLKRQVGRRMMNQGIANGWAAWYELWAAKTYAMEMLRKTGNRLRSPALSAALGFWVADAQRAKAVAKQSEEQKQWTGVLAERTRVNFSSDC